MYETGTKKAFGGGSGQGRGVWKRHNLTRAGDDNVVAFLCHPPSPPVAIMFVVDIIIMGWNNNKAEEQEQLTPPSNKWTPQIP